MREHPKADPGAEASTLIGRMTVMEEGKKKERQEGKESPECAPSTLIQNGQPAPVGTELAMTGGDSGRGVKPGPPRTPASDSTLPPLLVSPAWTTLQGPSPSSAGCVSRAGRVGGASAPTPPVPIFPLSPTSTQPLAPSPSPSGASPAPLLPTPTPSAPSPTALDAPVPFPGFSPGPSPVGSFHDSHAEAQGASGVPHALFFHVRSPSVKVSSKGAGIGSPGAATAGEAVPVTDARAGTRTGPEAAFLTPQLLVPEAAPSPAPAPAPAAAAAAAPAPAPAPATAPAPAPALALAEATPAATATAPAPAPAPAPALAADRESAMQALEGRFMMMDEIIGKGKFGTVRPAVDRATGEVLACKRVGKRDMVRAGAEELLEREVAAMETLQRAGGHRNIVQLRAKFEDEDSVCLLMDLCEEGELYDELVRRGAGSKAPFTATEAGRAFFQIVSGVAFCHANGVVHRDLKPENILLTRSKANASPFPALPCSPFPSKGPGGALSAPASPFSRALAAFAGMVPASPGAPSPARPLPFPSPMALRHLAPISVPGSTSSRLEHAAPRAPTGTPSLALSPRPRPPAGVPADASMSIPNSPDTDMAPAKEDRAVETSGSQGSATAVAPLPLNKGGPRSPAASGIPVPVPVPAAAKNTRGSPGSKGAMGSPGAGKGMTVSPGSRGGARTLCAQNDGFRAPAPVFGRRARRAPASVPAKLCPIYEGGEEEGEGGEELLRRQAGWGRACSNPWGRLGQRSSTAVKREREGPSGSAQSPVGSDPPGAEGGGVGGGVTEGGADGAAARSVRRCLRLNGAPGSAPRPTQGSTSPSVASGTNFPHQGRQPLTADAAAGGSVSGEKVKVGVGGLSPSGAPSDGLRTGGGLRQVKRCLIPSPGEEGAEGVDGGEARGKRRLLQRAFPEKDAEAGRKPDMGQAHNQEPVQGGNGPDLNAALREAEDESMDSTGVNQAKAITEAPSQVLPGAGAQQEQQSGTQQKEQRERQQQQQQIQQQGGGPRGEHILKIADFGLAVVLEPQETAKGVAGSPMYMAPEACAGSYDAKADVWSLGVILYILLCGAHPFPDLARAERERRVRRLQLQKQQEGAEEGRGAAEGGGKGAGGGSDLEKENETELRRGVEALKLDENGYPVLSWPRRDGLGVPGAAGEASSGAQGAPSEPIPEAAKGLVRSLLHSNPARRPTARKILTHPWLLQCVYGGSVVRRKGLSPLAQKSPVKGPLPAKPVAAKTALTPLRGPPNAGAALPAASGSVAGASPWSPARPGGGAGSGAVTPVRHSNAGRELFPPPSPWSPAALGLGARHGYALGGVPDSPAGARPGEGSGTPRASLVQSCPPRSGAHPHRSQVVLIPISPFPPLAKPVHRSSPRPTNLPAGIGTGAGAGEGSAPASASRPPQSPLRPVNSQAAASGPGVSSPWKPVSRGALGPSRMSQQGDSR